jgi:hypothetical protein
MNKYNWRALRDHYITQSTPRSLPAKYFRAHRQRVSDAGREINPDNALVKDCVIPA